MKKYQEECSKMDRKDAETVTRVLSELRGEIDTFRNVVKEQARVSREERKRQEEAKKKKAEEEKKKAEEAKKKAEEKDRLAKFSLANKVLRKEGGFDIVQPGCILNRQVRYFLPTFPYVNYTYLCVAE